MQRKAVSLASLGFTGSRKQIGWIIVGTAMVVALIAAVLIYQQPTQVMNRLGQAAKKQDIAYLVKQIDYPVLKQNLENNLTFIIVNVNKTQRHQYPAQAVHMAAINGASHLATPAGVSALLHHTLPELLGPKMRIVETRYRYLSWNRFQVQLYGVNGGHVDITLYRQGWWNWLIGDVAMVPPGMPGNGYPEPVQDPKKLKLIP